MAVTDATFALHAALIRLAKGMIRAWEEWVKANRPPPEIELDSDPVKHFEKHK